MAVHSDYGSETERLSGKWVKYDYDSKIGKWAEMFVRPLSDDARSDIREDFLRPIRRRGRPVTLDVPDEDREAYGTALLLWQWGNTRNFWITAGNDESAEFWSEQLRESVKAGQDVCIDDRLTPAIKERLAHQDVMLVDKIAEASRPDIAVSLSDREEKEEVRRKNSSSGSAGRSAGQTSRKTGAGAAASSQESEGPSDSHAYRTVG